MSALGRLSSPFSALSRRRVSFYGVYTGLFLVLCLLVFSPFWLAEKSFVWYLDGNYQHFNAFVYLGSYLRELVRNIWHTGSFSLPMWEFGIGYGGDIINTLSYYVLGDPLALVSAVTPAAAAETVYGCLILLRLYLAGLTFCAFCRKMDVSRSASLMAVFPYVFCAFSLYSAVRHPYFITPMIVWPLMLIGAEKLLRKERPVLFIVAVFLAAVSNFYFFYMEVLLTICYVAFRFFSVPENRHFRLFWGMFGRFLGFAVIGVAMAGTLLLPSLMTVLSDARADTDYSFSLFYSPAEYATLLTGFFSDTSPVYWSYVGLSPVALLGVGALFLRRRQDGWLKGLLLLFLLFLTVPVFGYVLNGFGYVAGRWIWGLSFLLAFIFAKTVPVLLTLSGRERGFLCLYAALFSLLPLLPERNREKDIFLFGCVLLLIGALVLCGIPAVPRLTWRRFSISRRRAVQLATFGLAVIGVLQMSFFRYQNRDYVSEFRDKGTALSQLKNDHAVVWKDIDDDSFYRIDSSTGDNEQYNYLLTTGQSTTYSYWSLQNPYLVEYMRLNSTYSAQQQVLRGVSSRSLLLPFLSATYYTCQKNYRHTVPYGYSLQSSAKNLEGDTIQLYQSAVSLPLGYTCEAVLSAEEYAAMSVPQRQQAMLYGAVVQPEDLAAVAALPPASVTYTDETLDYTIRPSEEITVTDGAFYVHEGGASLTLDVTCPAQREWYVFFSGLSFEDVSPRDRYSEEEWDLLTAAEKKAVWQDDFYHAEMTNPRISARCGKNYASALRYTSHHLNTHNRTEYLLNLNYSDEPRSTIQLTFSAPGYYTFDSLTVIAQPMEALAPAVEAMTQDVLTDTVIDTNRLSGTVALSQDKLLCLSIPYSDGWSLKVDGKEADLLRINVAFMGVLLSEGTHSVELTYCTPYLKEGAWLSVAGLAAFVVVLCVTHRKKKRNRLASL